MNNIDFKKLGDYVKIKTGKLDANASSEYGEYPFFTCSIEPLKISSYSYDCECCLVAGNGDLNVKYYNGKFDAYQRTYIIESLDKEKLDVMYLYFFLSSYIEVLRKQSIGGVIKYIKLGNLTDALIPIPELSKQKEICQNLIKAKKILSSNENLLSKYDTLIKSRFIEMFGDPVDNPNKWEIKKLKSLTTKIGSGATPKGGRESYISEGISLVRSMNVYKGFFEYEGLAHITEAQAKELDNVTLQENDVLLNITGASVARCCILPKDVLPARVNQHVSILRTTEKLNPVYLSNLLISDTEQRVLLGIGGAGGATREAITKTELESLDIPVPPIELQQQFAAFVQQIDKSKFEIWRYLKFCDIMKRIGFILYD